MNKFDKSSYRRDKMQFEMLLVLLILFYYKDQNGWKLIEKQHFSANLFNHS